MPEQDVHLTTGSHTHLQASLHPTARCASAWWTTRLAPWPAVAACTRLAGLYDRKEGTEGTLKTRHQGLKTADGAGGWPMCSRVRYAPGGKLHPSSKCAEGARTIIILLLVLLCRNLHADGVKGSRQERAKTPHGSQCTRPCPTTQRTRRRQQNMPPITKPAYLHHAQRVFHQLLGFCVSHCLLLSLSPA